MAIPAERLTENVNVFVRGTVSFSHLRAQYTGVELERRIEQQKKHNAMYATTDPHTTITLVDPKVVPVDPQNPTLEEQFIAEKFYTAKSGVNAGKTMYGIDDKSNSLPQVFAPNENGQHEQVILKDDLASGLDVTLVLRTFKPKNYQKRGIGLNQVIVNEPIRFYQPAGGLNNDALSALGITIAGPVTRVSVSDGATNGAGQDAEIPTTSEGGLPMPGLASAPAAPAAPSQEDQLAALQAQLAALQAQQAQPEQNQASNGMAQVPPAAAQGDSPFDAQSTNAGIRFGQ